jgi:hypothetical protein
MRGKPAVRFPRFYDQHTSLPLGAGDLLDRVLVAAPEAAIASATRAIGARASLIDVERAAHEILAVQGLDRLFGFGVIGHLHESESLRLAGVPVHDDCHGVNLAVSLERFLQFGLTRIEGHIAYVELHCDLLSVSHEKTIPVADVVGKEFRKTPIEKINKAGSDSRLHLDSLHSIPNLFDSLQYSAIQD